MTTTPRLSLPLLAAGQAQKHVTHNDALMLLDMLAQIAVASRLAAAPSSPTEGSAFIVPAAATGVFAGRDDSLAVFQDGGWSFLAPAPGWQAFVADEGIVCLWDGSLWRPADLPETVPLWGVNVAADGTNRLSVAAAASLFSHDGAGHQLKLNKAAPGDTASLLCQTGFSGRAEFGLAGDDDFHLKLSTDGLAWTQALLADAATGAVSLPATPWAAGGNLLVNGDMQVNQRGFAGGALAGGDYGFDRWRAATGGATLSRSGFALTLSAGTVEQVVEPGLWGLASFAGLPVTVSVEDLSGGALDIGFGSVSASLAPGAGRRGVTLTPAGGDTGALALSLAPAAGAVSFARVKLELGSLATRWLARPAVLEEMLCRRYFWARQGGLLLDAYQAAGAGARMEIALPVPMRAAPVPSVAVSLEINISGSDRGVAALSAERAYAYVTAAATGRVRAAFDAIAFDAEL